MIGRPGYNRHFYRQTGGSGPEGPCALAALVLEMVPVASAIDFGCGTGDWLAAFAANGVETIVGVDGDWVPRQVLKIAPEQFIARDLAKPWQLDRRFDLAVTLEVAEHLPESAAEGFVSLLVSAAPVVLFSAAIPGQGGTGHVNEQWPEYWASRFAAHRYAVIDTLRPAIWNDARLAPCIRQNMLLFVQQELLDRSPRLQDAQARTDDSRLSQVHPAEFARVTDPAQMSLRRSLEVLPEVGTAAWRRHTRRQRTSA